MSQGGLLVLREPSESWGRRDRIRSQIRGVMEQLEEVLTELKDVARELREVVSHIDRLTADIDLDLDVLELTVVSSSSSSDRRPNDMHTFDPFSDGRLSDKSNLAHLLDGPRLCSAGQASAVGTARRAGTDELDMRKGHGSPSTSGPFYQINGGNFCTPNSPLRTPYSPATSWVSREDREMYHALCCDDDDDFEDESVGMRLSRLSSNDSVFSSSPPRPRRVEALTPKTARKYQYSPGLREKALRSCSTQTVSDKSTQTTATSEKV
ncbi:inhibitory synaptic factor 1 [Denticeps clupeoides]|uniref:Inhibitory synaptic factor 1 n=1 Tax=Denticeps clupeoides TaxID=299321 RepID=A0AAY4CVB3_9TELE|nr:inhibitory synaptic factor 1-like [Denticeps clupeoides]